VPHANEQLIRSMYAAFAVGDMAAVVACCADDVVFRVPGSSRAAGEFHGKEGFLTGLLPALASVADMTTFRETVDAVACDDDHGIVLTTQSFTRLDGRSVEYRSSVVFGFRDGLMSEFVEHPGNQAEYDDAWA
jgi:ketosteroid isomerase-like protein